ncbi:AAA family ATPase [Nocardia farcinica]|uniref:AAA family ATPase n=1 Tax=Nocardia farcinica TaxID=37329 RepID=UPI002B4AC270|nr:AAA family ATPase [Nocardia farcinica]
MLTTLSVANYRSLRELVVPLGELTVITGTNGAGKSNLYRALRLLADTAEELSKPVVRSVSGDLRSGGVGRVG